MSDTEGIEKVDAWLKDWFPDTSFSVQDIREICRGPMKGIIQDFLVPRFRTEDQTYVIRSNLYAHGKRSAVPNPPGLDMEEETLRRELEDVELEKNAALNDLLEKSEKLRELQHEQRQVDSVSADALGFKRRHAKNLKETIYFSNALLEDLKPLLVADDVVFLEKEKHYESFKTIQDEAISLFQSIFSDGLITDSEELAEKNNKIHRLIEQVVKGGLSSKEIVLWHKDELEQAKRLVTETRNLFGNSDSSPLEEQAKEADCLKKLLTKEHLEIFKQNVRLTEEIQRTATAKQKAQVDKMDESFGTFAPVDFLKLVHKEELKSKLKKCQEISNQEVALGFDGRSSNESTVLSTTRNSFGRSDYKLPIATNVPQEKLEDMTSGLLRNWNETKSKLIHVVKEGREIIPDQFISALKQERKKPEIETLQSNCYLPNVVSGSEEISYCSEFEPRMNYDEPSLVALNPNSENWGQGSFVSQYNGQQRRNYDHQDLTNLWKQLEQTSAKTGSANVEILEQLIEDAKLNLNRFISVNDTT